MKININPFDKTLTSRGFFDVYEQFLKESKTSMDAYYEVENWCMENELAIRYRSFGSFQNAYYRFLNRRNELVRKSK